MRTKDKVGKRNRLLKTETKSKVVCQALVLVQKHELNEKAANQLNKKKQVINLSFIKLKRKEKEKINSQNKETGFQKSSTKLLLK